jgi:hypothetical protein
MPRIASLADDPIDAKKDDLFEFSYLVEIISRRLQSRSTDDSDTIALYGAWGSGKSSVIRLVKNEMNPKTVWVNFDALRYQAHGNVVLPLLHQVAQMAPAKNDKVTKLLVETLIAAASDYVKDHVPGGKYLDEFVKQGRITIDPKTGLPESPATVVESCFRELISLFIDNGSCRVVIAVDNLDRCQPSSVLQVIEAIHLILNVPGVSFLVAVDQDALIHFVNGRYEGSNNEAALYLEKVFPDYYRIPTPWTNDVYGSTTDPVARYLVGLVSNPECRKIAKYTKTIWMVISYSHALKNPRRIKRLIRRLSLLDSARWKEDSNSFVGFLFLVALSDIWPHVYRAFFYADPNEWSRLIDWILDVSEMTRRDERQMSATEKKLREMGKDEAFAEFVVATAQCFSGGDEFSLAAYKNSIIHRHSRLWGLLDDVAKIGL